MGAREGPVPAVYASGGPKCHHIMVPSSLHSRSREKERPGGYLALHDRHSAFVPGGCGWPIRSIPSHGSYHMRERNSAPSYGMNLSGGVAVFDRSPDWSNNIIVPYGVRRCVAAIPSQILPF